MTHAANIGIHVVFGTIALVIGFIPLVTQKGGRTHVRFGRWFLICLIVVIATAIIGIVAFGFRAFLGVITMLSAYEAWSGYRVFSIRATGPKILDAVVSLAALGAAVLFIIYLRSVHVPWAPIVIYSTLGALVAVASYDLVRFALPRNWVAKSWFYEHLVKMMGAYTAIVSAFSGTVLARWQPWSQMAPTVIGATAMTVFIVVHATAANSGRYIPTVIAADNPGDNPRPARSRTPERSA
jgi:xanthosine utilization system XapX-like protein